MRGVGSGVGRCDGRVRRPRRRPGEKNFSDLGCFDGKGHAPASAVPANRARKVSAASAGLAHRPFIGPARGSRLGCPIDRRVWVSGSSPPSQSRSARAQRSVRAVANRRGRPLPGVASQARRVVRGGGSRTVAVSKTGWQEKHFQGEPVLVFPSISSPHPPAAERRTSRGLSSPPPPTIAPPRTSQT